MYFIIHVYCVICKMLFTKKDHFRIFFHPKIPFYPVWRENFSQIGAK